MAPQSHPARLGCCRGPVGHRGAQPAQCPHRAGFRSRRAGPRADPDRPVPPRHPGTRRPARPDQLKIGGDPDLSRADRLARRRSLLSSRGHSPPSPPGAVVQWVDPQAQGSDDRLDPGIDVILATVTIDRGEIKGMSAVGRREAVPPRRPYIFAGRSDDRTPGYPWPDEHPVGIRLRIDTSRGGFVSTPTYQVVLEKKPAAPQSASAPSSAAPDTTLEQFDPDPRLHLAAGPSYLDVVLKSPLEAAKSEGIGKFFRRGEKPEAEDSGAWTKLRAGLNKDGPLKARSRPRTWRP